MQEGLAHLSAPARIWIDPIPSGMKNFALGVFGPRVGDLLGAVGLSLVGLTE